jgi:hypothetical protein
MTRMPSSFRSSSAAGYHEVFPSVKAREECAGRIRGTEVEERDGRRVRRFD